jgi:O-acetyl-ADP-ribose deacetylase (regulator of RNase III)
MKIEYYNGDLLTSSAPIIMHQCNCLGNMNSGVAKAIKDKWPIVFTEYEKFCKEIKHLLGKTLFVEVEEGRYVANLFGQERYGYKGEKYTSYDAIYNCLEHVAGNATNVGIDRVAMPYKMSSDRGGADWDVILAIVKSAFKDTDITVEIWRI